MSENKMTHKEFFSRVIDMIEDNEMVEFARRKLEQLEQPRKPRFNKEANDFAMEVIEVLRENHEPMTNSEIVTVMNERHPDLEKPISAQKVAAALRRIDKNEVMEVGADGEMVPMNVGMETILGDKASDPKSFAINL